MQRWRQSGFTLVELMVTLAVLVILAMLAVPSFNDLIEKSRLRGATDDIVNLLNQSRVNAVKLQRDVNVSVSSGTTWCAGAISAATPTAGVQVAGVSDCDCSKKTPVVCLVGDDNNGYQNALVSSGDYSGVILQLPSNSTIKYVLGTGGVTFNSKLGTLDITNLPTNPLMTLNSKSGKYSTHINLSALGQTLVCVPSSSPFVAGYPTCATGQ
ncbi:prepilin-type N-terminal cleavage/methylation domain-containing protein [Rudaea sp.]|uniref:prepilin-type N-terminal cleavage/methylation domain-containing protein n=1 Tax=Rudaea sp. TaxID=2136325 RepID=UPI002ED1D6B4